MLMMICICQSTDVVSQFSFPAVLVTDTAYLRGYMRECYHKTCDSLNNTKVTQENMNFLTSVTTALVRAVRELCSQQQSLPSQDPDPLEVVANTLDVTQASQEDEDVPAMPGRRKQDEERRNINYENVGTQINIENLHLTISGPPSSGLQGEKEGGYFYIDPAMAKIKQIIKQFYNQDDRDDNSLNSPMIIKIENDL